jgi:hypothetical protein
VHGDFNASNARKEAKLASQYLTPGFSENEVSRYRYRYRGVSRWKIIGAVAAADQFRTYVT